jgi:hypothetical protein
MRIVRIEAMQLPPPARQPLDKYRFFDPWLQARRAPRGVFFRLSATLRETTEVDLPAGS